MNLNRLKNSQIFQGGMGVAISNWELARTVSRLGHVGIVSGTGLAIVISRRLQNGDKDGTIRQALEHFPIREMGQLIWDRYFVEGGKSPDKPFKSIPMIDHKPGYVAQALLIVSNFVEVWLAKRGHEGLVGVNYLEKLQTPHLFSLFGAILAGADLIIAGAGLPTHFPLAIEQLSSFEQATYDLSVVNGPSFQMKFDPASVMSKQNFLNLKLTKPLFLGIVSTAAAARSLHGRSSRPLDGFVVELPIAGGHNAKPRKSSDFTADGQPIYHMGMGENDDPGFEEIRGLGLPFWIAGGQGSPQALPAAKALGAKGIQVGTEFSFCEESGHTLETKLQGIAEIRAGTYKVRTDPLASPSGYPFKVVTREGTVSEDSVYAKRNRICDLGYLRHAYRDSNGKLGWRCPAEPEADYCRKGGKLEDTIDRKCICNHLMGALGFGQIRKDGYVEPAIITSGDDVAPIADLLRLLSERGELNSNGLFTARQVVDYLLGNIS